MIFHSATINFIINNFPLRTLALILTKIFYDMSEFFTFRSIQLDFRQPGHLSTYNNISV